MKYKFPQFNIEIENPTIEIDLNSIQDKAIDKLLSVSINLIANNVRFGVIAENMPYIEDWKDSDIDKMVENWLKQFEVE